MLIAKIFITLKFSATYQLGRVWCVFRGKRLLSGLFVLLALVVLLVNVNSAWALPTVTPSSPVAGVGFTITGSSAPGELLLGSGSCPLNNLNRIIEMVPISGSYNVGFSGLPVGQYDVNDSTGCLSFMVQAAVSTMSVPLTPSSLCSSLGITPPCYETLTTSAGSISSLTTAGPPPPLRIHLEA